MPALQCNANRLVLRYSEEAASAASRPAYADVYGLRTMHVLIYASNRFEGSTLSKRQTMRMLQDFATAGEAAIRSALADEPRQRAKTTGQPTSSPSARREVLQHLLAVQLLCHEPALPLTEDKIRRTHAVLVDGLLDGDGEEDIAPGEYRTEPISAKGRSFMEAENVPSSMASLLDDFNALASEGGHLDPCLLASWLMAEFLTVHPFNDGNGRVARILFNYALRLRGFPFYVAVADSGPGRSDYLACLKAYQKYPRRERQRCDLKFGSIWAWAAVNVEAVWSAYFTNLEYCCAADPALHQ